jgi:hypothetical protein
MLVAGLSVRLIGAWMLALEIFAAILARATATATAAATAAVAGLVLAFAFVALCLGALVK